MRISVIGIGGIGGYFGSRLIDRYRDNEHEVLFIQRGAHLAAIRRSGLRYVTAKKEFLVNPALATDKP
ncbi:MAG TPA: 2-dehydropantoate 2-reductase N-terminal domain-containing protein, partial [Candidatus Edwardsbacteria bacterium]|nr:2-dehydropantoate 2-reductase N-terminal domain-containing protein [Candidatus Edwardsbacteria bacterium]